MAGKFPALITPMLASGTFTGKTAFITGGGTGLGKGMAKILSTLGADVAITGRRLNVLQETAEEISTETGNKVLAVAMDVRDPESVRTGVDTTIEELALPNVIINNAAGNFVSPTERLSANAFRTIVDIVLNGTANVTLDIGKRLIKQQQPAVFLSVSTWYAETGTGYTVPSACAKAGVDAMTKSLAAEWGKYGIRVNTIAPGPFPTEGAWSRLDPSGEGLKLTIDRTPAKRLGEVEELANLVSYMVSDYANYMSGEIVTLDGGERRGVCGMFNTLDRVSQEQWDFMEMAIRSSNKKSKE